MSGIATGAAISSLFTERPATVTVIDWGKLIFAFILLIAFLLFLSFYFYFAMTTHDDASWNRIKEAFQVILPAVTGTLGTVVGFYFGKSRE